MTSRFPCMPCRYRCIVVLVASYPIGQRRAPSLDEGVRCTVTLLAFVRRHAVCLLCTRLSSAAADGRRSSSDIRWQCAGRHQVRPVGGRRHPDMLRASRRRHGSRPCVITTDFTATEADSGAARGDEGRGCIPKHRHAAVFGRWKIPTVTSLGLLSTISGKLLQPEAIFRLKIHKAFAIRTGSLQRSTDPLAGFNGTGRFVAGKDREGHKGKGNHLPYCRSWICHRK